MEKQINEFSVLPPCVFTGWFQSPVVFLRTVLRSGVVGSGVVVSSCCVPPGAVGSFQECVQSSSP